uniref:Uncharacterized protein n=1 Tax=Chromera velia CCMP2878 TaxID=1169474 RepID=A0A0G4IFR8_9ALVE|eukprot:Cvel_2494.t1-p1 / transcript=Cvel_2494.t1 / gene=Cvel_2494 / organism=Chromera_velia_CCMP2878 / gene_product=hypothetical protein / transcript_product=hypothetical protein / location=Cvel_scaffold98:31817-32780(-) / protein_length=197 / sequence_SO=supercontig / SO=protein_coding / is_pseudo=false
MARKILCAVLLIALHHFSLKAEASSVTAAPEAAPMPPLPGSVPLETGTETAHDIPASPIPLEADPDADDVHSTVVSRESGTDRVFSEAVMLEDGKVLVPVVSWEVFDGTEPTARRHLLRRFWIGRGFHAGSILKFKAHKDNPTFRRLSTDSTGATEREQIPNGAEADRKLQSGAILHLIAYDGKQPYGRRLSESKTI